MFGNLFYAVTTLAYIGLAAVNLYKPNCDELYSELENEPKPEFLAIRNKYKAVVKNWLDLN